MLLLLLLGAVATFVAGLMIVKRSGLLYDTRYISHTINVASISMSVDENSEKNRQKMVSLVHTTLQDHPDTELILFGEQILGWYSKKPNNADYQRSIAETIPGNTTDVMANLAREMGIYLSFGMNESKDGNIYSSQVLINSKGEIQAIHRKFYLQGASAFQPGLSPVTMTDIKGIKTALIICSDIQSSTVRKELGKQTPELILGSLANPSDRGWFVSGMLAKMFDAWIITANRYGTDDKFQFDGQMVVSDPLGDLKVKTKGKEQVVYTEITFSEDPSVFVQLLRKVYARLSLIPHFIIGIGIPFTKD